MLQDDKYVINIRREVTGQDLSYLVASAMESGVYGSSWLRAYEAEGNYDENNEWIGFTITRPNGDSELYAEGDEAPVVNTVITLQSIVDAIAKLASDPEACDVHKSFVLDLEDYDAPAADIVIQVAVFGKVIYG